MLPNPQFPADLVTFTEEILNGKLHFLCSEMKRCKKWHCFWWEFTSSRLYQSWHYFFIFFISRPKTKIIDPFKPNVPFLHPQKMSENQRFSDILRRYRDRTLGQNGLKPIFLFSCKENKNMTLLQLQSKV